VKVEHAAELAVFEELFGNIADFVRPLDEASLNWRPLASETNSIAALVYHVVDSTNVWLARAAGETFERTRDREAQFRRQDSAGNLVAALDVGKQEVQRRFGLLDGIDLTQTVTVTRVTAPQPFDASRAWCVEHALSHVSEHWGAMQLTKQLYEAQPSPSP
jgi:uncharacterized damage-inducible protein DinB